MTNPKDRLAADVIPLDFTLERETKGTFRYAEDSEVPIIGSLYIQKWAIKQYFNEFPPKKISLVVETT